MGSSGRSLNAGGETAVFSSTAASITTSQPWRWISAGTVTGLWISGSPSGAALVLEVQTSSDDVTWTTLDTLTIGDGSTTPVSVTESMAVSAGDLVRVNVTTAGGGCAFVAQVVKS